MVKMTHPGLALSATGVCIARPGATGPTVTRHVLASTPADNGSWPELARLLAEVAPANGDDDLAVTLMPPLVEVRRLALPPLGDNDLIQLLTRNAARYFVGARGSQTLGARQWRGERGEPSPVLAAAAPSRFVSAIHLAAREAGWNVWGISPAEGAWAAAAVAMWPAFVRKTAHLLVHEDDRIVLIELDRGVAANVRRFRGGALDADKIAEAIMAAQGNGANASVGAFGLPAGRVELVRALGGRGISVSVIPAEWQEYSDSAEAVAAICAGTSSGPALANERVRAEWRARINRITMAVGALAVLLFFLAAGLELWGVHRELAAVRAERAAIRPEVSATLIGRTSLEDAYRRLAAIAESQRNAPHWAPILAELTERLPEDAYFTTVRTRGDSLVVDGLAASAVKVFSAIDGSPHLKSVRAPGTVRRQAPEGGDPMERFTLAATLPGASTKVAPASATAAGGKAP